MGTFKSTKIKYQQALTLDVSQPFLYKIFIKAHLNHRDIPMTKWSELITKYARILAVFHIYFPLLFFLYLQITNKDTSNVTHFYHTKFHIIAFQKTTKF